MSAQQIVLDASACISLLATRAKAKILHALPGRKLVPHPAAKEVLRDPSAPHSKAPPLDPYFAGGSLERVELSADEQETFLALVSADQPDDLGDGEAAALACGHHRGATVVVDDGKAIRITRSRFPSVNVVWTVELLRRAEVQAALGDGFDEALLLALTEGRMRVPHEHDAWVRHRLGPERASRCPSLKTRRSASPSPRTPRR